MHFALVKTGGYKPMSELSIDATPDESRRSSRTAPFWKPDQNDGSQIGGVVMSGAMLPGYGYDQLQGDDSDEEAITLALAEDFSDTVVSGYGDGEEEISVTPGTALNVPTHARLQQLVSEAEIGDAVVVYCDGKYKPEGAQNEQYVYEVSVMGPEQWRAEDYEHTGLFEAAKANYQGPRGDDRRGREGSNSMPAADSADNAATDGGVAAAGGGSGPAPSDTRPSPQSSGEGSTSEVPEEVASLADPTRMYVKNVNDGEAARADLANFLDDMIDGTPDVEAVVEHVGFSFREGGDIVAAA